MNSVETMARTPGVVTFTQVGASGLYRNEGEWPAFVLASVAYLATLKAPLMRWRDVDLVEFVCTNGRAVYRLMKYDTRRNGWVMRREYEENYG